MKKKEEEEKNKKNLPINYRRPSSVSPFASTSNNLWFFQVPTKNRTNYFVMCVGCNVSASQCAQSICVYGQTTVAAALAFASIELAAVRASGKNMCRQQEARTPPRLNNAFCILPNWSIGRPAGRTKCFFFVSAYNASVRTGPCRCTHLYTHGMARQRNSSRFSKTNTLILSTILNHHREQYRHTNEGMTPGQRHSIWNHLACALVPTSHDALSTGFDFSS